MKNLIGTKFGKLTVIAESERKNGRKMWECLCDCGGKTITSTYCLNSGRTKSCGCLTGRRNGVSPKIKGTVIYSRWQAMKKRCYEKNSSSYKNYGARGITVCDEWKNDPIAFYNWAKSNGFSEDLTLDRIDVNGNYCPENCRWTSRKEQNRNKRNNRFVQYSGQRMTIAEFCEITGKNAGSIDWRLNEGNFTEDEAVNKPIRKIKKGVELGFDLTKECKKRGLKLTTVWARINKLGWSVEEALCVNKNGLYNKTPTKSSKK